MIDKSVQNFYLAFDDKQFLFISEAFLPSKYVFRHDFIKVRTDTPHIEDGLMYCDKASPAVLEGLTILSFCRTTCIPGPSSLLLQQGRRNDTRRDLQL
jgi:hypothetical protein